MDTDRSRETYARQVYDYFLSSPEEFFAPIDIALSLRFHINDVVRTLLLLQSRKKIQYLHKGPPDLASTKGWCLDNTLEQKLREANIKRVLDHFLFEDGKLLGPLDLSVALDLNLDDVIDTISILLSEGKIQFSSDVNENSPPGKLELKK